MCFILWIIIIKTICDIMSIILDSNHITVKWTGPTVPSTYFVQANPRGLISGNEWFAIVNDSTKSNITGYAIRGNSSYFTPPLPAAQTPIPFNNIITTLVTNMMMMIQSRQFNQPVDSWDTSNVTNMSYMFYNAAAFDQPIGSWNTSKVNDMSYMFYGAKSFNPYIRSWNVKRLTPAFMFSVYCPLTPSNTPNWGGGPVPPPLVLRNIFLSTTTSINENVPVGTVIGTLSTDNNNPRNTTIYTLIINPLNTFIISGSNLITRELLNYTLYSSYYIEIMATVNGTTSITQSLNIGVTDIHPKLTIIDSTNGILKSIPEDSPIEMFLGDLYTLEPNINNNFIYQFVNGPGSMDNQLFMLLNSKLYTNTLFNYRKKNSYSVRFKSTDNMNLTLERVLIFNIVVPYSSDIQITTLVGNEKTVLLDGTAVSGKSLSYQITIPPKNGTLIRVSNGKYTYYTNKRGIDSFSYIIREGTMVSQPIPVTIHNYSQADVATISKNHGTFNFDNVTFDGDTWQFGPYSVHTFIQNENSSKMGSFDFSNQ